MGNGEDEGGREEYKQNAYSEDKVYLSRDKGIYIQGDTVCSGLNETTFL